MSAASNGEICYADQYALCIRNRPGMPFPVPVHVKIVVACFHSLFALLELKPRKQRYCNWFEGAVGRKDIKYSRMQEDTLAGYAFWQLNHEVLKEIRGMFCIPTGGVAGGSPFLSSACALEPKLHYGNYPDWVKKGDGIA